MSRLTLLGLLAGCGIVEPYHPTPPFCDGHTVHLYDPVTGDDVEMWPDPWLTYDDASSPTGIRVPTTMRV